jgi:hypothetical protein
LNQFFSRGKNIVEFNMEIPLAENQTTGKRDEEIEEYAAKPDP